MSFKLTYATMFNPPAQMHERFEAAAASTRAGVGAQHTLFIDGKDVAARNNFTKTTPVDGSCTGALPGGRCRRGRRRRGRRQARLPRLARHAARRARAPHEGRRRPDRGARLPDRRRAVPRGRQEPHGRRSARRRRLPTSSRPTRPSSSAARATRAPWRTTRSPTTARTTCSVLKPHGVWAVIAPFNFPLALMAGPTAAALVTGNTVVAKGATDTPVGGPPARRLHPRCRRAGRGVQLSHRHGQPGRRGAGVAQGRRRHHLHRLARGRHAHLPQHGRSGIIPRPCIAEMGGKNAAIVTKNADLERAVPGIVRSAFGLSGQKCSALSRVYVEDARGGHADRAGAQGRSRRSRSATRCCARTGWARSSPPPPRRNSPATASACASDGGRILDGGKRLTGAQYPGDAYVTPTLAEAPATHPLFAEEMFLPVLMVCRVPDLATALAACQRFAAGTDRRHVRQRGRDARRSSTRSRPASPT